VLTRHFHVATGNVCLCESGADILGLPLCRTNAGCICRKHRYCWSASSEGSKCTHWRCQRKWVI